MQTKIMMGTVFAALLSAAAAPAQEGPPAAQAPGGQAWSQKHFAEMCSDQYAREVGDLAFLETKLAPNDQQKRLFDRWKAVKLASAKAHAAECAAMKPPAEPPSIVEGMKQEEKMLQARLADLKAELPALTELFNSLSDEQKHAFEEAGPIIPGGPKGHHHPPGPPHGDFPAGHGLPGRDAPPPGDAPAPPAQ